MKTKAVAIYAALLLVIPVFVFAAENCSAGPSTTLCNAIGLGGATDIPGFIKAIMAWIGTIIGTLSIVMIVFSGGQMIVSQGDPAAITKAKTALTYSIIGFAVSVFAFMIISGVQYFIGASEVNQGSTSFVNPLGTTDLQAFVSRVLRNFLSLLGTLAVLMIIVNGLRYVTARGNEDQTKKARAGITWAVIGLISVIMAYVIISVIANFLN